MERTITGVFIASFAKDVIAVLVPAEYSGFKTEVSFAVQTTVANSLISSSTGTKDKASSTETKTFTSRFVSSFWSKIIL